MKFVNVDEEKKNLGVTGANEKADVRREGGKWDERERRRAEGGGQRGQNSHHGSRQESPRKEIMIEHFRLGRRTNHFTNKGIKAPVIYRAVLCPQGVGEGPRLVLKFTFLTKLFRLFMFSHKVTRRANTPQQKNTDAKFI